MNSKIKNLSIWSEINTNCIQVSASDSGWSISAISFPTRTGSGASAWNTSLSNNGKGGNPRTARSVGTWISTATRSWLLKRIGTSAHSLSDCAISSRRWSSLVACRNVLLSGLPSIGSGFDSRALLRDHTFKEISPMRFPSASTGGFDAMASVISWCCSGFVLENAKSL